MKTKISKRDLRFFLLGILSMILLDLILDWNENISDFKEGYNSTQEAPADPTLNK